MVKNVNSSYINAIISIKRTKAFDIEEKLWIRIICCIIAFYKKMLLDLPFSFFIQCNGCGTTRNGSSSHFISSHNVIPYPYYYFFFFCWIFYQLHDVFCIQTHISMFRTILKGWRCHTVLQFTFLVNLCDGNNKFIFGVKFVF